MARPHTVLAVCLFVGLLVASVGDRLGAAEWSFEPSLSVRGDYNSNLLLTQLPHESAYGHWVSPGAKFAGSTERLEVSGRMAADFVQYYGGQDLKYTNLYFPLTARHTTERDTVGFDGGFTRDNTLMGELLQTGVALRFTQRDLWNVNPTWTHALTEKIALQNSYQYLDATYQNGLRLGLVDYRQHIGMTGVVYKPTERDHVQMSGVYVNFHVPDAQLRSNIYGGLLSFTHQFSESLTGILSGGPRMITTKRDITGGALTDQELVWVASGSLERKYEDLSVRLDAAREINPSGFGLLLRTDRVGLTLAKQVTETVTATLTGQLLFAEGLTTKAVQNAFPQNRYVYVSPKVIWHFSDWWAVDVSYTYGQRDVESLAQKAVSNAAYVSLTYFPPKLAVSR